MPITTGPQVLQHISQGHQLTLDGSGTLQQQGGISKFLQSIGDALRGLTAAGRAGIAERNARLENAMADLIRRDELLPNLASGPLPPLPEGARAFINKALANMFVEQSLRDMGQPETLAPTTKKVVQQVLEANPGLASSTDAAALKAEVNKVVRQLMANPHTRAAMNQSYVKGPEDMDVFTNFVHDDLLATFRDPGQQRYFDPETGMHRSYGLDAERGLAPRINGARLERGSTRQQREQQLMDQIPPTARPFVSMVTSQAGLGGSLLSMVLTGSGTGTHMNSEIPGGQPFPMGDIPYTNKGIAYTVTTHPDRVDVQMKFQADVAVPLNYPGIEDVVHIDGDEISVTVSVPLGQFPLAPGTDPQLTVHSMTRTPVSGPLS